MALILYESRGKLKNGKMCRWFVLHDEEAKLQDIDAKWEQVEFQTAWKLEPCFRRASTPVSQPLSLPEHGDSSLEPVSTPVPTHSQSPLPTAEATPDVAGVVSRETSVLANSPLHTPLQTEVSQDVLVSDDHSDTPFLANSLQLQLETQIA